MKFAIVATLLLSFAACDNPKPEGLNHRPKGWFESDPFVIGDGDSGIEIVGIPAVCESWTQDLPELPIVDGSSSTVLMHAAIRAFLTDEHFIPEHSQTYAALERLLPDSSVYEQIPADVLLAVRYADSTLERAKQQGADLAITPVAREGFVFILHKDNPVDSITQEQLRGIYSGKITNWNQLGGLNEQIIPYSRNWDSGSQTAMEEFMEGENIISQDDITQMATMGAMLFGVQSSKSKGIGYNIFSWSMLQNLDELGLKTVAVDGIKPSNDALSDASYPLMVYTYSYYNRGNEKAAVFTDWLLSEQGQKVIAAAGYVGINGQLPRLPSGAEPNFRRDEFYSNRAVIEYYHGLESSRIERSDAWRFDWQVHEAYVRFPELDGSEHKFTGSTLSDNFGDRDLIRELAGDKCKGVTVMRTAYFMPQNGKELTRFVVLTREQGEREFTVINEGLL